MMDMVAMMLILRETFLQVIFLPFSYLRQVLDESLRMSTLAPYSGRFSDTDIVVGGYLIPKETPIVNALGVALKNETIWKDPHT